MSAHDQLERQLRASVAHIAGRRPAALRLHLGSWSRGLSALIVGIGTLAALGVAVFALVALHHGRPPSSRPAVPATTHHGSRIGPRPRDPGPIPRNVDDSVVAAAWNAAWRRDPACRPGPGPLAGNAVSYGVPSAAMLSTVPVLRRPATSADRLPARFYFHGRLTQLTFQGGKIYVRHIRRARVADGSTFYLVPATKLGRPPLSAAAADRCYRLTVTALRAGLPKVPPAKRAATRRYGDAAFAVGRYNLETSRVYDGVFLFAEFANGGVGGGGGGQSLSSIRQGGPLGGGGGGKPPRPIVLDGIVPSGVATVTLQFPTSHHGSRRLPPLSATGDVVNDVFVIPIPTLFQRGGWPTTAIWRSASGKVIKTVDERPFHP
jgi:hypothetical protein